MPVDRRLMLTAGVALSAILPATAAMAGPRRADSAGSTGKAASADELGLVPDAPGDQSKVLQAAIDRAAERGLALMLPPGRYRAAGLRLRPGSRITGAGSRTILAQSVGAPIVLAQGADGACLTGLVLEGGQAIAGTGHQGLVVLERCRGLVMADLEVRGSQANGIVLTGCSGSVRDSYIAGAALAGLLSLDAEGLEIAHCSVEDCDNNGILVWRGAAGEDGTIVCCNRIRRIRAAAGGSGQNGNGVNVYRAGGVVVSGNRIEDCVYSAIRGNSASNLQMIGNSCVRLGEVALYAEFAFEGALIASNLVDGAATGISVTNFNEGGRLAVVQGNLVRNLVRREHEPEDKRGEGIGVEADCVVTGNVIENAPTAGLVIGWGPYMREVVATSNVIRRARVGIMITRDPGAGAALIAQNMISGTLAGAIRAMDKGLLVGPDLVVTPPPTARIAISGNLAVA